LSDSGFVLKEFEEFKEFENPAERAIIRRFSSPGRSVNASGELGAF
jgi:hypothetical protein